MIKPIMNGYNRKSIQASLRGRSNRAEGLSFEELVSRSCEFYRKCGIADIEKTPEPIRPIGKVDRYGRFTAVFEKQAQPDYKGVLKGGRCIVFDTKETTTGKISISALSETQKETLLNYNKLGAVSGVLMAYSFTWFYFMPIDIFLSAKLLNNHQYWTADETKKQVEPIRFQGINLDFLKNMMSGDDY